MPQYLRHEFQPVDQRGKPWALSSKLYFWAGRCPESQESRSQLNLKYISLSFALPPPFPFFQSWKHLEIHIFKNVPFGIVHFSSRGNEWSAYEGNAYFPSHLRQEKIGSNSIPENLPSCFTHSRGGRKETKGDNITNTQYCTVSGSSLVFQETIKNQYNSSLEVHWTPKQTTMTHDHLRFQAGLTGFPNLPRTYDTAGITSVYIIRTNPVSSSWHTYSLFTRAQ